MDSREPESNYEEEPNHELHDNPSAHNEDDDRSQPLTGDGASPGLVSSRTSLLHRFTVIWTRNSLRTYLGVENFRLSWFSLPDEGFD